MREWFHFQRYLEQMKSVFQGPDVGHYEREPLQKSTAKDLAPEASGRTTSIGRDWMFTTEFSI